MYLENKVITFASSKMAVGDAGRDREAPSPFTLAGAGVKRRLSARQSSNNARCWVTHCLPAAARRKDRVRRLPGGHYPAFATPPSF